MKKILAIILLLAATAFGQIVGPFTLGVDTTGDTTVDKRVKSPSLLEGSNVTISVSGNKITLASTGGASSSDSLKVIASNGDSISSTNNRVYIVPSTNITITVANDTAYIASAGGASGTGDTVLIYQTNLGASITSISNTIALKPSTGIAITLANDTAYISSTIGASVDSTELDAGIVDSSHLQNGAVGREDLIDGIANSAKIQDTSIVAADIKDSTVTGAKIASLTIGGNNLAAGSVDSSKQVAGVTGQRNNSIDSTKIVDGSVSGADLHGSGIDSTKMVAGGTAIRNGVIDSTKMSLTALAALRNNSIDSNKVVDGSLIGSDIKNQTLNKSDLDTTAQFPFAAAFHSTSAIAESAYITIRYMTVHAGDSVGRAVDSIGIDTTGDGNVDKYLYPASLREGTNTTFSVSGDMLTISATGAGGTSDSIGIDTTGDATADIYIYPAVISEGTNTTLSVSGDVVTISATGAGGTSDSVCWDTSAGAGTDAYTYPTKIIEGTYTKVTISGDNATLDIDTSQFYTMAVAKDTMALVIEDSLDEYYDTTLASGVMKIDTGDVVTVRHPIFKEGSNINISRASSGDTITLSSTGAGTLGDSVSWGELDGAAKDSIDIKADTTFVRTEIEDSLDEYTPTADIPLAVGNFIDSTTLDTIQNAHKAVLSDSTNKITDQSINKTDIDTTSSNIPFDGAFHITTAVAESAYASQRTVYRGDSAQADTGITITAGDGLTGGGNLQANRTLAVGAGTGISVSADAVSATLGTSIDSSEINPGTIDSTHIQNGTVAGEDLKDSTITGVKIASLTVGTNNIAAGAVDSSKQVAGVSGQRNNSIDSTKIVDGSVSGGDIHNASLDSTKMSSTALSALRNNSVDSNKIVDGTVINADIKNGTIDSVKQVAGVAGQRNNSVDSTKIVDGSISGADIRGSAVDSSKLAAGALALRNNSVDSNKVAADNLAPSDINWDFEWVYLTQVHGFNKITEDSVYLNDFVMYGDTAYLAADSCAGIVSISSDTFSIVGNIPYGGTIDSLEMLAYCMGSTSIDTINFYGPDRSNGFNMGDSSYWGSGSNLTGALSIRKYSFTNDISALAGDRFRLMLIVNFATDNDIVKIGWVRLRLKR